MKKVIFSLSFDITFILCFVSFVLEFNITKKINK